MRFLIETAGASGQSLYAVIFNPNGQVWSTTLNAGDGGWEAYASGHWAQYAVALTEAAGSGYYSAEYPGAIGDVLTTEVIYNGSPATLGDAVWGLGQSQGSNVAAVDGDASAPAKLQRALETMVLGSVLVNGDNSPSSFTTSIEGANLNAYQGRAILFATGELEGEGGTISGYDTGTQIITVTAAFTATPAEGDKFVIS